MDVKIQIYLIGLICVRCIFVQADIGDVNSGLQYQLYQCLDGSSSMLGSIAWQQSCLQSSVLRCLLFHEPHIRHYEEIELFCGVINSGQQIKTYTWYITLHNEYSLFIDFLHFHLPNSPHCKSVATLSVTSMKTISEQSTYTYCGHRTPWHISFPQSHAIVQCKDDNITPKGFHFVFTFQAFDIKVPSTTLVQWNEHELYSKAFTFANLAIGQTLPIDEVEIHLHILIPVYNRIVLHCSHNSFLSLKIYDGPGPLSPEINTTNSYVELSSYQGFVKFSTGIHANIADAYTYANNHSYINSLHLNWSGVFQNIDTYDETRKLFMAKNCLEFSSSTYSLHLQGPSGRCLLGDFDGSMAVHQLTFTGVNMLRHSPSSRTPTCQYGGLFLIALSIRSSMNDLNYITICSNVSHKANFPINTTISEHILGVYFITFEGYSSGFVDITFSKDQECFGSNVAISRGPACENILSLWPDKANSRSRRAMAQCTDVWLLNEIDLVESLPFENCTFMLDHAQLGFPVESFIMTVYSSIIHQTDLSNNYRAKPSLVMDVGMDYDSSFVSQTGATNFNFTVDLSMQNEYTFDSVAYTMFKIRLFGYDKFPVFAIRVQYLENRICLPTGFSTRHMNSFGDDVIHMIGDSISDVYLSSRYPYDEISSSLPYRGYNHGTCRALVKGHKCSNLKSNYLKFNIHYRLHKTLVAPQEIDISLKRITNCSVHCPLNVTILEYIGTGFSREVRYHSWE